MKFPTAIARLIVSCCFLAYTNAFTNPIRSFNGGDPNIVHQDGWYYLMSTTWNDLQMARATSIEGLKTAQPKQVWSDPDGQYCCNVWAPEMHFVDGAWRIYFAAGRGGNADNHMLVLTGGKTPWDDFSSLVQLRDDWSIDGTVLKLNGKKYFVYSGFTDERLQSLYIAEMPSATTTLERHLLSMPTENWELSFIPVNEGPHALYNCNKTMLVFSASFCATPDYALGLLTYLGGDPLQATNWRKDGPIFRQANGHYGPGHNSFFISPSGTETWNVFHSTPSANGDCGGNRVVNLQLVNWREDGTPDLGIPAPWGTEISEPY